MSAESKTPTVKTTLLPRGPAAKQAATNMARALKADDVDAALAAAQELEAIGCAVRKALKKLVNES